MIHPYSSSPSDWVPLVPVQQEVARLHPAGFAAFHSLKNMQDKGFYWWNMVEL